MGDISPSTNTSASHAPTIPPPVEGLQRLLPRHYKIIELALDGFSNISIANMMNMTAVGIGIILRDAKVQHELARRRDNVQKKQDDVRVNTSSLARDTLNEMTLDAVETLDEVRRRALESGDHTNARLACKHILDKAWGEGDSRDAKPTVLINIEQLNVLNQALKERGYVAQAKEVA
jgi:hypothetical protein